MENNTILSILVGAVLILSVVMAAMIVDLRNTEPVALELPAPIEVVVNNVTFEIPDYIMSQSEFENSAIEAEALRLATESVDSRDFKKAVFDLLEDVESYKDISEIKFVDVDVDGNEVSFDIKVYYFIDGDEDETFKARLNEFTVNVNDLDFDDDFEDAEVDEDYLDNLTVKKVYEI